MKELFLEIKLHCPYFFILNDKKKLDDKRHFHVIDGIFNQPPPLPPILLVRYDGKIIYLGNGYGWKK